MEKLKNFVIGILIGFGFGFGIHFIKANPTDIQKPQSSVYYETMYVNGTQYLIFMSPTGDIEVFRR